MVSGPRVVLALALVAVSLTAATAPNAAVRAGERPPAVTDSEIQPQTAGDSSVTQTLVVDLQRNGDARWTITKTFNITSRNDTDSFQRIAESFESGETDDLGLASYRRASRLVANSTGRDMRIVNVTRSTNLTGTPTNATGRLSISFTWTNFGRLEGDKFYIDDVFTTGQGPWLDGLYANQRLVVRPPEGYQFFDAPVPVTLRNGTIQWTGPREFDAETLSATFENTGGGGPGPQTPGGTTQQGTTTPNEGGGGSMLWAGLVTLGLGAVVVGYLLARERDLFARPGAGEDAPNAPPDGPGLGGESTPPPADGATETESASPTEESESDDAIDVELLSDEERVERLLEENGGRMKQANIVKETNWSNAKVSQLLSSMEEDGQIDKLRIGRENLISFPDEDVTDLEE